MYFSGENIVRLRKKVQLTQQEFAAQIGYSRTYLSDIEVGKVDPSRRFLEAVTEKFGVSLDSLANSGFTDYLNYIVSTTNEEYFVFIYGFTDEELATGERELILYLEGLDHVIVDADGLTTSNELLSRILGGQHKELVASQYKDFCQSKDHSFILIKNLSKSKIAKKGTVLRTLIKDSCQQTVMVLDRPSFLEKHQEELYSIAKITPAR